MPNITGITHWALRVNNLEESERFYTDIVGLEPRGRLNDRMSCFSVCGLDILLCEQPEGATTVEPMAHHSFTFTPDEWERAVKHVCDMDVQPDPIVYRERGYYPGRELYFSDPSGNRLEFRDPTWRPGMPTPSLEEILAAQSAK